MFRTREKQGKYKKEMHENKSQPLCRLNHMMYFPEETREGPHLSLPQLPELLNCNKSPIDRAERNLSPTHFYLGTVRHQHKNIRLQLTK